MYMHQTNNKSMKFYLIWKKSNNEILRCRMKSSVYHLRWNQIRLYLPALAGFHRVAISSTKWIYSDAGGFSWKSLRIVSNLEAFFGGVDGTCTRVRKHVPDAFYMLSLRLSFSPRRPQTGKRFEEVKMPLRFQPPPKPFPCQYDAGYRRTENVGPTCRELLSSECEHSTGVCRFSFFCV